MRAGCPTCVGGVFGPCVDAVLPSVEACDGLDNDCDGVVDGITRGCSNACGDGTEACTSGGWAACDAPLNCECEPGTTESVSCGECGTQARTCDADRAWRAFTVCDDPGHTCAPSGSRRCVASASYAVCEPNASGCLDWSDPATCVGEEVCEAGVCGEPACVPACAGRTCGGDGCGGVCGTCADGEYCDASARCAVATPTDLFLIIGQSNSVGYGTGAPTITSVPGAYEIDYAGGPTLTCPSCIPPGVGVARPITRAPTALASR